MLFAHLYSLKSILAVYFKTIKNIQMKKTNSVTLLKTMGNEKTFRAANDHFRNYVPSAVDIGIQSGFDAEQMEWADTMDCFEYHVRAFVCGKINRMHRIYYELRRFAKTELIKETILLMFEEIHHIITENEIYEYMGRFNIVKSKCYILLETLNNIPVDIEKVKKEMGII